MAYNIYIVDFGVDVIIIRVEPIMSMPSNWLLNSI